MLFVTMYRSYLPNLPIAIKRSIAQHLTSRKGSRNWFRLDSHTASFILSIIVASTSLFVCRFAVVVLWRIMARVETCLSIHKLKLRLLLSMSIVVSPTHFRMTFAIRKQFCNQRICIINIIFNAIKFNRLVREQMLRDNSNGLSVKRSRWWNIEIFCPFVFWSANFCEIRI